ncbi:MAG: TonB-dependent receptor [Bacteroidales bacterium]
MRRIIIFILINLFCLNILLANDTSPILKGKTLSNGEAIPFATVIIKGTTIGTASNQNGDFKLTNLPMGNLTIRVQAVGYKPKEVIINTNQQTLDEIVFNLEEDILGIDQVVITADRNEKNRKSASVIVSTITPKIFIAAQTQTLSDGLNFCPGLRTENNCQNCGFNQVRMNGMEGPYSQILINNRPIFSGLAGVYGLELIPSSMLERIEVIRGGGSALYGSNAIAGTINLILKDPINNSFEIGFNSGSTGVYTESEKTSSDYTINFNTSLVSEENKTGMALYGFYRNRNPYDANKDNFSELSSIENITLGTRVYHRPGNRNKIAFDFFNISEKRRGGNSFNLPEHEALIAESAKHMMTTGAITFEQFMRDFDIFSVFVSAQNVNRDSYYGANRSLKGYGQTNGFTYNFGTQYNAKFTSSDLISGIEYRGETLFDEKLGYRDIDSLGNEFHTNNTTVADQTSTTIGVFAQYEIHLNKLNVSLGARFDNFSINNLESNSGKKSGNVLSPRVTIKYDIVDFIQARASYSQGYRAPQIFDEDLHILTSGSRQVIHKNDANLTQETSHSFMASLDLNKAIGTINVKFLAEGFYTRLNGAFVNEYSEPDLNGVVIYTRVNAEGGAIVKGINFEFSLIPSAKFYMTSGFTVQSSRYEKAQEFNEKSFFRTPNNYGYLTIDWDFYKEFCLAATANYTGSMLVPYFGVSNSELRKSDSFYDLGLKLSYDLKLKGSTVQVFGGIKNILNSYQTDFDRGIDRDPGYLYGPSLPRTVYVGVKFGNLL